ncbi:MAG: GHKL domain-containing protein [Cyclobacteriaceae bacterium]|nr:GHKL domain-containing protein [Cyclobacteriaceae bacterium]
MTTFLFVYLVSFNEKYVSAVIVAGAIIIEIIDLFRFTTVTNKKITKFLESIRYSDFSSSFSYDNKLGKSFRELNKSFNNVADAFRKERAEKEEHLNYLNTIVQHVTTGLLSFDNEGKVGLINSAARRFLNMPQLRNISEILAVNVTLYKKLKQMGPGEKALIRVSSDLNLAIHATELKLRGHSYKLVACQNIHSELESKEVEAWQNLTRVLRHEIMNSITPIASLTGTLNEILSEDLKPVGKGFFEITDESLSDLEEGLQTIENRSKALVKFVDAYRDYTSIPKPKFGLIKIDELFDHICQLLKREFKETGIDFNANILFNDLEITADRELIEMVLINLLKNAKEALKEVEESKIELIARVDGERRILLDVKDNGPGIIPEALERIFIPFYTTKKSGSGIGLALSRQIMQLHHGTLSVKSEPDLYTIFTLRF